MSAFGGKADIVRIAKCPLITQSGHELFADSRLIMQKSELTFAVACICL